MATLQEQLFIQAATHSLNDLAKDLRKKYEPKKGDRFSVKGITYEIGPPRYVEDGIRFEISSKIPGEELPTGYSETKYFKEIKKVCQKADKKPSSGDMENIIRETRDQERKERDYVKLSYQYSKNELFDEKKVIKEVEEFSKNPDKERPPAVPGANTLAARLILIRLGGALLEGAEKNIQDLIKANDAVRSKLKKLKSK
ncbi:MAG: hypothetical protein VCE91_08305 [Nitrospinota bacterium]